MVKFSTKEINKQLPLIRDNAKKTIDEYISWSERSLSQKIIFSKSYLYISLVLLIFFIGLFMFLLRTWLWSKRLKKILPIEIVDLYAKSFNGVFSNTFIIGLGSKIPTSYLKKYRGDGIPYGSWIKGVEVGPKFKLVDSEATLNIVTWEWHENKSTRTRTKAYWLLNNTSSKYEDLNISISKNTIMRLNKGKDMDNEEFNKSYVYSHNDPIKFRMLFTILSQEKFVKLKNEDVTKYFNLNKVKDNVIIGHKEIGSPLFLNVKRISNDHSVIEKELVDDVVDDLKSMMETFKIYFAIPTLLKK